MVDQKKTKAQLIREIRDLRERLERAGEHRPPRELRLARLAVDHGRDAVLWIAPDGRFVDANPTACRLLGRSAAELASVRLADIDTGVSVEQWRSYRGKIKRRVGLTTETTYRAKSGELLPVEVSLYHHDVEGEEYYCAVARDLRERVRSEQALWESEELYRTLVETAPCAVTMIDLEGRLTFVSRRMLRLYGFGSAKELLGRRVFDLFAPEDREKAKSCFEATMDNGAIRNVEYAMERLDGSRFMGEVSCSLVRDGQGHPTALVATIRDVTARRQAEAQRRALEAKVQRVQKLESLGVLAGGVAHAFNNLLTSVLGNTDMALRHLAPTSGAVDHLRAIEDAAQRAAELASQMLAYSGKGKFVVELINLSRLVEGMRHLLTAAVPKKVALEYRLAETLPSVEADPGQIRAVIMNLVTNASEAIGEETGRITIATGQLECDRSLLSSTVVDDDLEEGTYVYLEVTDTGCGIDSVSQFKIFDPFYTTKFTGRGLGLAAALGIIRGHRGAISVVSEENRGSTFRVLLPASERVSTPPTPAPRDDAEWRGGGTVLLVDDEEAVRSITKDMLEVLGFDVLVAADGREGVELFRAHSRRIAVVLLDIAMPEMGGEEALERIRAIDEEASVVLMSGFPEEEAARRFSGQEFAGFLKKPFKMAMLKAVLRRAMEES